MPDHTHTDRSGWVTLESFSTLHGCDWWQSNSQACLFRLVPLVCFFLLRNSAGTSQTKLTDILAPRFRRYISQNHRVARCRGATTDERISNRIAGISSGPGATGGSPCGAIDDQPTTAETAAGVVVLSDRSFVESEKLLILFLFSSCLGHANKVGTETVTFFLSRGNVGHCIV